MAKKEAWDFECPQYVDFERELDSSGKDDIYFDCKNISPENGSLCTPEVQGNGKGLTDSDENKLLSKMTAALSMLENTPKIKKSASRGKLFPETISKSIHSKITKSTIKPNTVPAPHLKRKSRSLNHLNKIISGKTNKEKGCRLRKSSSLNDLRTHKWKYPTTPMCLKRTIFKAKEKIKTTEEMELEEIAKLQKQLIQHLRENEISLKKLNLRPRQYAAKTAPKFDKSKDPKGIYTHAGKSNISQKDSRRNIHTLNQAAAKKEASKLDTIINNKNASRKKVENTIYSRKSSALSVSTIDTDVNIPMVNEAAAKKEASKLNLAVVNGIASSKKTRNTIYSRKSNILSVSTSDFNVNKSVIQKTKKLTHNRIMDHSGLIFVPSVKSNMTVKPYIFEAKIKEMKPQITGAKQKETSALNLKETIDKENSGCSRPQFAAKKTQQIQNGECDINKLSESNKITGKRTTKALKGVPLAENTTRN